MAAGDLTCSPPVLCVDSGAVVTAVNALNLTAATDFLQIIPLANNNGFFVFKVERAAA